MNRFVIRKNTHTHADALAAFGAADVLRHLDPRILAFEDRFEVEIEKELAPSDIFGVDSGFPYFVLPNKKVPKLPEERVVRFISGNNGAPKNRMFSILRRMKAYAGPNQMVLQFVKMRREDWESAVWDSFHGGNRFVFPSPLVQLFNPQAAKGYAFLKPTGTIRRDKTKDRWADPFLEWLRLRGYFEGAAGWFATGDLRLYCPIPASISYEQLTSSVSSFRALNLGGSAVKMDCRAVLGLTRSLIETASNYVPPRRLVSGLWLTQYKDMGQAHTVMAMEQLALPDWFDLETPSQGEFWLETLNEHDTALRRLADTHSDDFSVLQLYRRTFQTQRNESIAEFVRFLAAYGALVFKKRAQGDWQLLQFSHHSVAAILGSNEQLKSCLENPHVDALVSALRNATLVAQTLRHRGKSNHREIRYGLLSNIQQAGKLSTRELIQALRHFLLLFNRESDRRRAAGVPSARVSEQLIEPLAAVLERLPPVFNAGALLCALACCQRRSPNAPSLQPEQLEEALA